MQDEEMKLGRETNRTADTGEKQNRTHTGRKLPK